MFGNKRLVNIIIFPAFIILGVFFSIGFLILLFRTNDSNEIKDVFQFQSENIRDFKEWGDKTDKTYTHHYETMYGQLLGPFRNKIIHFMEIGLG